MAKVVRRRKRRRPGQDRIKQLAMLTEYRESSTNHVRAVTWLIVAVTVLIGVLALVVG